jgi:hypothetical protein
MNWYPSCAAARTAIRLNRFLAMATGRAVTGLKRIDRAANDRSQISPVVIEPRPNVPNLIKGKDVFFRVRLRDFSRRVI